MYLLLIKPTIDFILALAGLIILLPIFILVSIILFIFNGRQVFFTQLRPGKNEIIFKLYKFKTMNDKKDNNGKLLPESERITKIGKLIRRMSLDEIPQLINVLIGDMSLVGPRPLLVQYLPLYDEFQRKRHLVKPGITGWAQVNGRNSISWQQKFELDIYYVNHLSINLDLKIILKTIINVFKMKDINQSENLPMKPFNGNL